MSVSTQHAWPRYYLEPSDRISNRT